MNDAPARRVGNPWYRAEDYEHLRSILVDGSRLPAAYDRWLQSAEQVEGTIMAAGFQVTRVVIEPDAFLTWCSTRDLAPDSAARSRYAAEAVVT